MITNTSNSTAYTLPRVSEKKLSEYLATDLNVFSFKTFTRSERKKLQTLTGSLFLGGSEWRFPVLGTSSAKTEKGEIKGWLTGICYLSPAAESGFANLCLWAGNCKAVCLNFAGRGALNTVQKARQRKTARLCHYGVELFLLNAALDLLSLVQKAKRKGFGIACRLDGTSDLGLVNYRAEVFGGRTLAELFPSVSFYEYTKSVSRMFAFLDGEFPQNVHLTFSYDGLKNRAAADAVLNAGGNVAVCFADEFPETFLGAEVINGDETDLRFLDQKSPVGLFEVKARGCVVGLKAKGRAKRLETGFVVRA